MHNSFTKVLNSNAYYAYQRQGRFSTNTANAI